MGISGELVSKNKVSMDWLKKGFVQIKDCFYFASAEYDNESGDTVAVFFTPNEAFLWADNGEVSVPNCWSINDLVPWVRDNLSGEFPHCYEEFVRLTDGEGDVKTDILEKLGIEQYADDIEARLADISPLGELKDISL